MKKLYRSKTNKVISGLLGGVGEHFDIDPTMLRLVFIFLVFFTGVFPGVLAYVVGMFIVPVMPNPVVHEKAETKVEKEEVKEETKEEVKTEENKDN